MKHKLREKNYLKILFLSYLSNLWSINRLYSMSFQKKQFSIFTNLGRLKFQFVFLKVIHFLPQLKFGFIKYTLRENSESPGLINKSLKYIGGKLMQKGINVNS